MKKFIIGLLAVLIFATTPVMAGNLNGMQVDPNDKAVVAMLWMVFSDLQMCQRAFSQSALDNVSSIGHLNNAQSALRKSQVDPAYYTLIGEIDKRISKIKFYLVMNERRAVAERLQQLMMVIRNVLGDGNLSDNMGGGYYNGYNPGNNNGGFTNNGGFSNNGNNGYGNINNSGFVPIRPEVPVSGQVNPGFMPILPSGVVPAN